MIWLYSIHEAATRSPRNSGLKDPSMTPSFTLGHNQRRILETLRLNGPLSRIDIAEIIDLRPATLTRLSQELIDCGMLEDVDYESVDETRSAAKRKTRLLRLNSKSLRTAGVAFSIDRIAFSLSSLTGEVVAERVIQTELREPDAVANLTKSILEELMNDVGMDRHNLLAAGVSLPINFSENRKRFFTPSEWPLWRSSRPKEIFEQVLGVPTWVENDAHAAALAEVYFGTAKHMDNFCLIYFAYGIGGGTIINRRLYRGSFGNAAAIGGMFPQDKPRPSGRDLLNYLSSIGTNYKSLFELPHDVGENIDLSPWIERATDQLDPIIRHIHMFLDCEAVILGGLLPKSLLNVIAERLRQKSTSEVWETKILLSDIERDQFHLGAASIPQYEVTAPHKYQGRAIKGF